MPGFTDGTSAGVQVILGGAVKSQFQKKIANMVMRRIVHQDAGHRPSSVRFNGIGMIFPTLCFFD